MKRVGTEEKRRALASVLLTVRLAVAAAEEEEAEADRLLVAALEGPAAESQAPS